MIIGAIIIAAIASFSILMDTDESKIVTRPSIETVVVTTNTIVIPDVIKSTK